MKTIQTKFCSCTCIYKLSARNRREKKTIKEQKRDTLIKIVFHKINFSILFSALRFDELHHTTTTQSSLRYMTTTILCDLKFFIRKKKNQTNLVYLVYLEIVWYSFAKNKKQNRKKIFSAQPRIFQNIYHFIGSC